jgi:copper homeostasis protein
LSKLIEVIVTSLGEAIEAEHGGADRLELVRSLEEGGLTPPLELVRKVARSVSIPVRVMLRENASMSIESTIEIEMLKARAGEFAELPIDGFVLGFVRDGSVDLDSLQNILTAAPELPVTFHRAFEHASDPLDAIDDLKRIRQIDRLLTGGGGGSSAERKKKLLEWQEAASPRIKILVGVGVCSEFLAELNHEPSLEEIHVGRAARVPQLVSGIVNRNRIAALKL